MANQNQKKNIVEDYEGSDNTENSNESWLQDQEGNIDDSIDDSTKNDSKIDPEKSGEDKEVLEVPKIKPRVTSNVVVSGPGIGLGKLPLATTVILEAAQRLDLTSQRNCDQHKEAMILAKQLAEHLAETSRNFLEAERLRLESLKGKNTNAHSVLDLKRKTYNKDANLDEEHPPKIPKLDEKINKELRELKDTVEQGIFSNSKINVKRDYKLTIKSNFDIWMDYLRSELMSNELIDVIDPTIPGNKNLPESAINKRKSFVRDIIINHIDENYHKKILNITDPIEILNKLRVSRKEEANITAASVRKNLHDIRMKKNEKVNDFRERFDAIIRDFDGCGEDDNLTEQEIRTAFYYAVITQFPELRSANLIKSSTNKPMTFEEIKTFISQLEAELKGIPKEEPLKAQRANVEARGRVEEKCWRCNRTGHFAGSCPLEPLGKWFCYYCQAIKSHKGNECPLANQGAGGSRSQKGLEDRRREGV